MPVQQSPGSGGDPLETLQIVEEGYQGQAPSPEPHPSSLPTITLPSLSRPERVINRLGMFSLGMARRRPYLVGSLVGNPSLADETIDRIATGLQQMVDWTEQRSAAAGIPGYVAELRNMLMQLPVSSADIVSRNGKPIDQNAVQLYYFKQDAMRLLDEIQKLGPKDQSTVLAILSGHPLLVPVEQRVRAKGLIGQVLGEHAQEVDGHFAFDGASSAAAVATLFPDFPVALISNTAEGPIADQLLSGEAQWQATHTALTPFGDVSNPRVLDYVAGNVAAGAAMPFQLAGLVGGTALEITGGKGLRDFVGGAVRLGESSMMKAGDVVIKPALSLAGLKPGDPGYEASYNASQFLFQAFLLHAVGKAAKASKVTASMPRDIAAAELQLRGIPADYLRNPVTRVIWDLRNKTPQEWITDTRIGREFLAEIIKLKQQGGDISAAIAERWGGAKVPGHLARALAEASVDDVARVFIDSMDKPAGAVRLAELTVEKAKILAQLEEHNPVVEIPAPAPPLVKARETLFPDEADPAYLYHVTREANLGPVAESGLRPGGPPTDMFKDFPGQTVWEGGATEPRLYFSPSARIADGMAGAPPNGVLLRVRKTGVEAAEGEFYPNEVFTLQPLAPDAIEYLASDGTWQPLSVISRGRAPVVARIETPSLTLENAAGLVDETVASGGATWDPRTGEFLRVGEAPPGTYSVAINNEGLKITRPGKDVVTSDGGQTMLNEANRVIDQYPQEFADGAWVGTWESGGEVYVDPSKVLRGVTEREALIEGARTGQQFIFDIHTGEEIAVPKELIAKYGPRTPLEPGVEASMRAQLLVIEELGRRALEQTPVWRFPKKNILRAALRHPVTRMEKIIAAGMKPLGKLPEKFVDELPTYPTLYSPIDTSRPLNWLDHNADVASKWLRRTGVDQTTIESLLGELFDKVKDGESFYEWMRNVGDSIDRALPRRTPPELRATLTQIWDRPAEARTRSVVSTDSATAMDGTPMRTDSYVLRDEAGNPLPSMPTEFAQSVRLPNIDYAIEATSLVRRGARALRKAGVGKVNLGLVYDVPKFFLQLNTAILKPAVLVTRLPALTMRIQMEQFVRAWLHEGRAILNAGDGMFIAPGGMPIPGTSMRLFSGLFGEDGLPLVHGRDGIPLPENPGDLGMMMSSMVDLEGRPMLFVESTGIYNKGGVPPKPYIFRGWADSLLQLHNDRLIMEFVRRNLDVDKMREFMTTDDWGVRYMEQQGPLLAGSQFRDLAPEVQVKRWLEMKKEQILQQTAGGSPELLDLIRTGRLRRGDLYMPKDPATGVPLVERYLELRDQIRQIEDTMGDLNRTIPGERAKIRALDESRRILLKEMKAAERGAKVRGISLRDYVSRDKVVNANKLRRTDPVHETKYVANALRNKWERNEVDLPDHIAVSKRVYEEVSDPSVGETVSRMSDAYSRLAYSPLRALTAADLKGTRGSLYYDIYRRAAAGLERQGWAPADIPARATIYAAERTRDIMYDLGAKTSVHRALKDLFWFAPAWQEIIYTWGVKIPSQYHWPIGVPLLLAKGNLIMDLFRETGIIQKNANGEDVVVVPVPGIVDKFLAGLDVKLPDKVYFRTEGLNMVTSGGLLPGVSTGAGFLLGEAALKWGGIFKEISDFVQPFGPEASFLPSPIVRAYEAVFGEPPPFELYSPDLQKAQYDRMHDLALQYAFADLRMQGVHAPRIGDFKSDEKYKAAFNEYYDRLFSEAQPYLNGMMFVRLMGSTVSPASLSYSRADEEAWRKFWTEQIEPGFKEGTTGFSEEQRARIDEYLLEHPNSLGYATFFTAPGEKVRDLPFTSTEDDNVWDEYYTGERRYKTPEEFALTLAISESRRFLVAKLNKAMEGVGDTASEQLRNGYFRAEAIGAYLYDWDRYVEVTPGAEAILDQQRELFAEKYGIPIKSYEQERLAQTIGYLNRISGYFTNEVGMRTSEVKAVLGELKALYSDTGEFGEPNTPVEKARAWYFENVLGPYIEKTSPLYAKAQELDAAGLYAGDIYDKIRALNDRLAATSISHKGEDFPTPEEVFFGNRSPEEQVQARLTWATRPPAWLSGFQQEQVGYPTWEGSSDLLQYISDSDKAFYEYIDKEDISTSSKDYDSAKAYLERKLYTYAKSKYGDQGLRLLALQRGAPYVRLEATILDKGYMVETYGQTAWNKWKSVTNAVEWVSTTLLKEDYSPRGFSEMAIHYKSQLYAAIQQFAKKEEDFRDMMRDLSYAMPQPGLDHRSGALLFNALFFNNFDTQYVPDEITTAGKGVI